MCIYTGFDSDKLALTLPEMTRKFALIIVIVASR